MGVIAWITSIAGLAVLLPTHHLITGHNDARRPEHRAGRR